MFKYQDDLRSIVDRNIKRNNNQEVPPFDASKAYRHMIEIPCGMKILRSKNTLHRDLKASNILLWSITEYEQNGGDGCVVADYKCSIAVMGTTYWRAPEVMQALQERREREFTTKTDVYSYATTCFEILTRSLPFEDHSKSDYGFVISGTRPALPRDISAHTTELLSRCLNIIPAERPEFS